MSYDISLVDPVTRKILELDFEHHMRGGTYAMNGTKEMWLNVTYNYGRWYREKGVFPTDREENGIRSIYGMTGLESIDVLKNAINTLENMDKDLTEEEYQECLRYSVTEYWMPTRENAIKPLYQLLAFAKARPDGVWEGD